MINQLELGPMGNFTYIVGDASSKTCAVIDPGFDIGDIIREAKASGLTVTHVLLTHSHFDHARGAKELSKKTGAKIYVHEAEAGGDEVSFKDGQKIKLGELEFSCLHTPGHTQGSTCFIAGNAIFTGDTLFVDGIGRTDLDGGNEDEMFGSLKKLADLPEQMIVYPGHNYGGAPASTIGEQKRTNPYLNIRHK